MRKIGLINDIEKVKSSRWTRRILTKYPIDLSNVELFNITVKCLVALTKSKRISLKNQNVLFTFNDLSEVISSKSSLNSDMARYLLAKKFKRGHPLLRTQGHRLIAFLRTYFHYAPDEIHEVIYDIRKHIAKMQWYWRKYDPHFFDLKTLQMKMLLDVTLGLNVLIEGFLPDAGPKLTRAGYVIKEKHEHAILRHHLDVDEEYFVLDVDDFTGKLRFKLIPFDIHAHDKIHDKSLNSKLGFISEVINARMLHLYDIFMKRPKNLSLREFRERKEIIDGMEVSIWEGYSDDVLLEWMARYYDKENLYRNHYPYFDEHFYQAMVQDFEFYKKQDVNCKHPEFWSWYLNKYFDEEKFGKVF